ncbi:MAG TPA: methyltransferase domain-containing protein [Casimicrobiaceae bacterium]|nr:methyltransferase domain-containing protein [Casimicrobiaceae bacterium]
MLPALDRFLDSARPARVFEVGCGNGSVANWMASRGIEVSGIDFSESGIAQARRAYPELQLAVGSAYDDLSKVFGQFPVVISLEVIEHLYFPRRFARSVFDLLEPGGTAFISIPFHGYLKNLALALTGRMDAHFTALWDGGHIKFFSEQTLGALLREAGFGTIRFLCVGRVAPLAKSMVAIASKPVA